jgi:micrococcal nuclease
MGRRAVLVVVVALLLLVLARAGFGGGGDDPLPAGRAEVVRVVDGDTVVLRLWGGEEHVRLIGVDTPETVKPDAPVECYGPEASAHLHDLLPVGTEVRVARDAEARDRYGRLLLYLWLVDGGEFVNLSIVRGGFGEPLAIAPNTAHERELAAAAAEARAAGRGLWGRCGGG